jgi:hypothetical protein
MSDPTGASGANHDPSGDGGEDPKGSEALERHKQRLLDETRKAKDRATKAETRLAELEAKEREREDQELEKQKNFEQLLKNQQAETAKEREKRLALEEQVVTAVKTNAFHKALGAKVDDKFKGLIDLKQINFDPETGQVDEMSVAKYVDDYRKQYPETIKMPGANGMPSNAPKGGPKGKIPHEEWVAMKESPEKWALVREGKVEERK